MVCGVWVQSRMATAIQQLMTLTGDLWRGKLASLVQATGVKGNASPLHSRDNQIKTWSLKMCLSTQAQGKGGGLETAW